MAMASIGAIGDLYTALVAAGIPVVSVVDGPPCYITYDLSATAAQMAKGASILAGFDLSQAAQNARDNRRSWGGDALAKRWNVAIGLPASPQWTDGTLTAQEKATITAFIKAQAAIIIAAMRA